MDPSWLTSQPKSAENQDVQVPGTVAVKGTSDIPDPDNRPQILGIAAPNLGQQSLTCITAPGSSSSQITQAGSFAGYSRPMLNAMLQDDIPFVVPSALVNHTAGQHAGPSIGTFSDLPAGWSQVPISILRLNKKRAAESDTMPQLPLSQGATLPPDLPRGSQYGTSVQLTQNHFLPLGGASNMVTSNMALPPSTSVTPDKYGPVTAPFQPNGPGAEASKARSVTEACIQRQSATVVVKNSCTKEASITPRKANGVRGQHPQELNCLAGEGSAEDNTQKYPGMQNQAKTRTNQSDDPALLTPTVSNKCTFTQIEMQISEVEQLETIINENETQVQRSKPRRKRHRPKVIREGKPSKTQETAVSTPKVPPNSTVKRTNIRKKRSISSLGNSPGPSGDKSISSAEALTFKGQATSVRRRLQFEHDGHAVSGEQRTMTNSQHHSHEGHAVSGEQRTMTNSQHHSHEKLHHPQALKCSVTQSEVGQGLQLEIENEPGGIVSGPSHKLNENSPGYPQPQGPSAASGYFGRAVQLDNSRDMALKQDNVSSAHNLDTTRQFVSQIDERLGTNSLNVDGLQIYCSARLLSETGSAESQMGKVQQVENQKHEQHSNWRSISIGTRNSILRTTAKIVASCQAGGIKKKRSICSSKIPSDLIKDLEKNTSQACQTSSQSCMDALPETTHLKFTTKKRPQRARLHSSSCVEPNMENKNRASTGNIFSSRSNGSSSSKPLQGSLPWTLIGYTPHNTSTNVDICNKLPKGCMVSTSAMPYMDSSRSVQKNFELSSEQVYRNETHLSVAASPNIVPLRKTSDLQNALVPYVGSIDPYGRAWNLVKKQRAKVDLDFESTRAWNLLMGKTVNPVDGADVEKEKWWQQERNVFQGRANSFIARMRLVQGDRHFSPWKGSVVDSVVGVFLTQNVTDHLSSSAFMALAASFPPRSTDNNSKDDKGGKDNEEITRLAVQDENRLHFCGNGVRLDLNVHCENLSQIHDRIRTDPKNNTCDGELIKDDNYYLCDEASNESLYNHQGTKGPKAQPFAENSSIELVQSTENAQEIQFHQEIDSSQSIPTSDTFLQSGLSMCSGEDHKPQNFVDNLGIAAFQVLEGNSYDENISAGNNAVVDEVEYQITGTVTVTDDLCQPGISRSMLYPIISDVNHPQYDAQNKSFGSPTSAYVSSGSSSLNKTNSTMEKCSSLFMPHDAYTTQNNGNSIVDATLEFPVKLHHNKHTIFEASDLKDSIAFSTTDLKSGSSSYNEAPDAATHTSKPKKTIVAGKTRESFDWDNLRRQASVNGYMKERNSERRDSVDWEAVRSVHVQRISHVIRDRGMNNILAERIQEFLNRLVRDHGSIDLEWLRDIPPDSAKDYLLSIRGLGLKSVECVRLLTLHHLAFPVDTNVGRICVRLGWVPLQPLPESLQLHLLELYPVQATIQKYLWPRLCKLDLQTLYELHYQMITFGKVFCTKNNPNCNACPMRSECKHFASAFASARLALPAPQEKSLVDPINLFTFQSAWIPTSTSIHQPQLKGRIHAIDLLTHNSEPVIEEPESPREEEKIGKLENDIEDFYEDPDQIPTIKLNMEAFTQNLEGCLKESNKDLQTNDIAKALVSTDPGVASIPIPKLKNVNRLRTEHYVYELPDSHPLTQQLELDQREPDDPSPYLLIIRMLDETKETSKAPMSCCSFQVKGGLCNNDMCHTCASERENQSRYVKGTILVPCRTAMRGSFPLNGTYFQVNEVFADHSSSHNPVLVPREQLWNLRGRIVYFGTSVPTIFKGLTTEETQQCFWKGFICVRGFERESRAPKPLCPHLHIAASKMARGRKTEGTEQK